LAPRRAIVGTRRAPRSSAAEARTDTSGAGSAIDEAKPIGTAASTPGAPATVGDVPSIPRMGITINDATPFIAHYRDSLARLKADSAFIEMTRHHPPTGREKAILETSQHNAERVAHRATTAGSADVHVPQGKGIDGVGAVGGAGLGASIGLPLFSKGKSAEQRKKDEAIDAEYQARLRRLQEIIRQRRDSIRADSIAKAGARIVP
jgi:hypothetical protein